MKLLNAEYQEYKRWILTVRRGFFVRRYIGILIGPMLNWCYYPGKVIIYNKRLRSQLSLWQHEAQIKEDMKIEAKNRNR